MDEATTRVLFGWSNYKDFADETDALAYAREIAAAPEKVEHYRDVQVIDLTDDFPHQVLFKAQCPKVTTTESTGGPQRGEPMP